MPKLSHGCRQSVPYCESIYPWFICGGLSSVCGVVQRPLDCGRPARERGLSSTSHLVLPGGRTQYALNRRLVSSPAHQHHPTLTARGPIHSLFETAMARAGNLRQTGDKRPQLAPPIRNSPPERAPGRFLDLFAVRFVCGTRCALRVSDANHRVEPARRRKLDSARQVAHDNHPP